jgi:hypothetical protein
MIHSEPGRAPWFSVGKEADMADRDAQDAQVQLLADALTRIVDVADAARVPGEFVPARQAIERAGDIAAEAHAAAATYGALPPPRRPADLAARAAARLLNARGGSEGARH